MDCIITRPLVLVYVQQLLDAASSGDVLYELRSGAPLLWLAFATDLKRRCSTHSVHMVRLVQHCICACTRTHTPWVHAAHGRLSASQPVVCVEDWIRRVGPRAGRAVAL